MEKFPKFIIEGENLILRKVNFHHEIATDKSKVKGGGWFKFKSETNTFILFGDSHDFGKASFDDVKKCVEAGKVFYDRLTRNISATHKFSYNTGSELRSIEFKPSIDNADK